MRILECHSKNKGTKDFSALYAKLLSGHTIEQVYQKAKRDENMQPIEHGKGVKPSYMLVNGQLYDHSNELRHFFYGMLWHIYFLENPDLFDEACQYEGYKDIFDHESGRIYTPMDTYLAFSQEHGHKSCNQAAAIAWLVGLENNFPQDISLAVLGGMMRYWSKYHPFEDYPRGF